MQAAFELGNASGRKVVALNMDETMIAYGYSGRKGTVVTEHMWDDINDVLLVDGLSSSVTKMKMSLTACIASDTHVQSMLPQNLQAKKKTFPQYLADLADAILPENVAIKVRDSIWTTQETFVEWLNELHASLFELQRSHYFILIVDASRIHINEEIARRCAAFGFLLIFIPAGLTWLLQPLDVYVFADFKWRIKERPMKCAWRR